MAGGLAASVPYSARSKTAGIHERGAAISSRFSLLSVIALSTATLVAEFLEVFLVGARQQIEEGVEAAIERSTQLRNGAVEGVQRESGRRPIRELQRRFVDALERPLRNQPNAVDECVA